MTRIIRFHGWDAVGKKGWVYGDLTHNMKVTTTDVVPRAMVGGYEVHEDSIGQFTGLTDKNGKGIFEGDIVTMMRTPKKKRKRLRLMIFQNALRSIDPMSKTIDYGQQMKPLRERKGTACSAYFSGELAKACMAAWDFDRKNIESLHRHLFINPKKQNDMSKKMFALVTGIVGGLQAIGVAVVTYSAPEYATAINSAIVIAGAAVIEICNLFTKTEAYLNEAR